MIRLTDVTLRDGMHAVGHRLTLDDVRTVAGALAAASVDEIEVAHGDGLGGSTLTYGPAAHSDAEYLAAAAEAVAGSGTQLTTLLLPGIGTIEDLEAAVGAGAQGIRVATHCTEADIGIQHIAFAKAAGLDAVGFLMMAHRTTPARLADQAALLAGAGADAVYVVDSAGALLPGEAAARVRALLDRFQADGLGAAVGFHAHQNLGLGVANTLAAVEAGATRVDGSLGGMGAGAGNAPAEALAVVLARAGHGLRADPRALADAAEDLIRPVLARHGAEIRLSRDALALGAAGVYSSFLLHARRAAASHGLDARDLLDEAGRRGLVGGQEDLLADVAVSLAAS